MISLAPAGFSENKVGKKGLGSRVRLDVIVTLVHQQVVGVIRKT
jgi:hypothetical protein